ncbi:ThuA domain-containing protein [Nocardiopsis sp. MG754419]|uniref:ThuA domain-containing protein n=1 Tax=Nocardiopsis sp. MG754419 TaxID=2259865 RepID=UPI001BABD65F|nr:ThuA domain-containing protein [Nocardiopsis sp. MG754419]MBR8740968.1 sugar-binding protein [Nocardiopsis sp. MG754419]
MISRPLRALTATAAAVMMAIGLTSVPAQADEVEQDPFTALIFSKTTGFRHDSIPHGVALYEALAEEHGFETEHTEDADVFNDEDLARFDAVIWLSTTGDVLDEDQQAAFENYVQEGGGYVGVHSASDTHYDWEWYGDLVGAYFASHPPGTQDAEVMVNDRVHPSTEMLPASWDRHDEWYDFDVSPRGDVHVLAGLNEASYEDEVDPAGQMGFDHPIAWCQTYDGGRSWYTGGGHTIDSYSEPEFADHLLGGLRWAAGEVEGDCGATQWDNFEKVTLAQGEENVGEPMGMAVLPDGRVMHTSRDGQVSLWSPETYSTTVLADVPVYDHDEDGLQGIALDPDFENNGWVYLYYAPVVDGVPSGAAPEDGSPEDFAPYEAHNNLSRFQFSDGDSPALDLESEQVILEVEATRGMCCHVGGDLDFDHEGNLLLSTGDDTSAFGSDGYTPIDERESRNPAFDAQRSSANTNDLRGKLIRVSMNEDGTYEIPEGNLFPEESSDADLTRPEIFAMGLRNPFRFAVDQTDGSVYLADYGPDAPEADPERGPENTVTWHHITEASNIGWPYCIGNNSAYIDYDYDGGTSGEPFDCDAPVNDSPRNTGLTELPPVTPAEIWYGYDESEEFPHLGTGGGAPMGGPAYHFDPELESDTKWPEYYDGVPLLYEWSRQWIKQVHLDDEGGVLDITETVPDIDLANPMDMEFGPDGSLYVLEYGSGWFGGSADSAISRIDYIGSGDSPVARASADTTSGTAPLTVEFSGEESFHPGGQDIDFAWNFGDGNTSSEVSPTHTFTEDGRYTTTLTVTDAEERSGTATVTITVGNTRPDVAFQSPRDGEFFNWGDEIPFDVSVEDDEDGSIGDGIECDDVQVTSALGHDTHAHPWTQYEGCEGVSATGTDGAHGHDMNIFWVLTAEYTDGGGESAPPLTGSDGVTLNPSRMQAQYFRDSEGVQTESTEDSEGGLRNITSIGHGDWTSYDPVNLHGVEEMTFRVASEGPGGAIEARQDAPDGELLGSVDVTDTGGPQEWTDVTMEVTDPGETFALYLVFTGDDPGATDGLFNLNYFEANADHDGGHGHGPETELTSPEDGASFEVGEEIPLAAEVTDHGDTGIEQVEFLVDGEAVATVDEGPYEATWTDAAEGEYEINAVATDGDGETGASATHTITVGAATEPNECAPPTTDEGYTPLWDGASLDGWNQAGPGGFDVVETDEGCVLETVGGMGLLWHETELDEYRLKLDYLTHEESDNSGVFVGFPDPEDDPWVAVEQGYEIQIDPYGAPEGDPINRTGAIYEFQAATSHPEVVGEWNTMEIEVVDPVIRVWINDTLVNEFTSTDPARDLSSGFVGLQNHGDADTVWFRDVQVTDEVTEPEPVTFAEVAERIDELAAEGALTHSEARRLTARLELAEHHVGAGRPAQAGNSLDRFVAVAETVSDESAGEELLGLAARLRHLTTE